MSNPPTPPSSTPDNPKGEFKIIINQKSNSKGELTSQKFTNSNIVNLKLFTGENTNRMAISNNPNFKNAGIIQYQENIEWELFANPKSDQQEFIIYAKFYTKYGAASEAISASIIFLPEGANSKAKIFAYNKPRLKSLAQEKNLAKDLKQNLEKHYGENRIPVHKKHWSTIVNSYIYGNYPILSITQAIKFGGKTVHPEIPFSVWQKTKDYLEWIKK